MAPSSSDMPKDSPGSVLPSSSDSPLEDGSILQEEVRALYSIWARPLLQYARTFSWQVETAQDAVQETFLRYFLYRSEGGVVLNQKAWLFKVMRNFMLDSFKDAFRRNKVDLEEASFRQDPSQNPQADIEVQEVYQDIMKHLTLRELECIRLRTEGFDYAEIADLMGICKGTVGALVTRAIQKIQKYR